MVDSNNLSMSSHLFTYLKHFIEQQPLDNLVVVVQVVFVFNFLELNNSREKKSSRWPNPAIQA